MGTTVDAQKCQRHLSKVSSVFIIIMNTRPFHHCQSSCVVDPPIICLFQYLSVIAVNTLNRQ